MVLRTGMRCEATTTVTRGAFARFESLSARCSSRNAEPPAPIAMTTPITMINLARRRGGGTYSISIELAGLRGFTRSNSRDRWSLIESVDASHQPGNDAIVPFRGTTLGYPALPDGLPCARPASGHARRVGAPAARSGACVHRRWDEIARRGAPKRPWPAGGWQLRL